MLGELGTAREHIDVLEAIPEILARCPDLEFWFGGDGDVEQVKAIVETKPWRDQVRVLGWVNTRDKKQLLEKAFIFLLPSHDEGLPLAMLEAMAWSADCQHASGWHTGPGHRRKRRVVG